MTGVIRACVLTVNGLWAGVLFTIGFVFAPYLFALAAQKSLAVPNTGVAADLIGPLLWGADAASLAAAAVLLAGLARLRRAGQLPLGGSLYLPEAALVVAAACSAVNLSWLYPGIRAAKEQLAGQYGTFHLADRDHPLYLHFNTLHQTSTALFVVALVAAVACLVCLSQFRARPCAPSTT